MSHKSKHKGTILVPAGIRYTTNLDRFVNKIYPPNDLRTAP